MLKIKKIGDNVIYEWNDNKKNSKIKLKKKIELMLNDTKTVCHTRAASHEFVQRLKLSIIKKQNIERNTLKNHTFESLYNRIFT